MTLPEISGCGVFDSKSAFHGNMRSLTRKVTQYEIEYYPEDGKTSVIDGEEHPILAGNIVVAKPGQMRYSILHMRNYYLWLTPCDSPLCTLLDNLPDVFNVSMYQKYYTEAFSSIKTTREINDSASEILAASKLCELVYRLSRDAVYTTQTDVKHKNLHGVMKVLEYVDKNFTFHLTLNDLAKQANLSPIYLHKLFSHVMGKTPHEYISYKRIEYAKELLLDASRSLSEIAAACGFCSQSYFCSAFKKLCGTTPAAYRAKAFKHEVRRS